MITTIAVTALATSLVTYLVLWRAFGRHPFSRPQIVNAFDDDVPPALQRVLDTLRERPLEFVAVPGGDQEIRHPHLLIGFRVEERKISVGTREIKVTTFTVRVDNGALWQFTDASNQGLAAFRAWNTYLNARALRALETRDTLAVMEASRAKSP